MSTTPHTETQVPAALVDVDHPTLTKVDVDGVKRITGDELIDALQMVDRLALAFDLRVDGDRIYVTRTGIAEYTAAYDGNEDAETMFSPPLEAEMVRFYNEVGDVSVVDVAETPLDRFYDPEGEGDGTPV